MLVQYNGCLGKFVYDNDYFIETTMGGSPILEAKNSVAYLNILVIPKGIINCSYMFESLDFKNPNINISIPEGVKIANNMFQGSNIKINPILPSTLKEAIGMFASCRNLVTFQGDLPKGLLKADYMFARCYYLQKIPQLPSTLKSMTSCFKATPYICPNFYAPKACIVDKDSFNFDDGVITPICSLKTANLVRLESLFNNTYIKGETKTIMSM